MIFGSPPIACARSANSGLREDPDRLGCVDGRHDAVERVQQHQPRHAGGMIERPVDAGRSRHVVHDRNDLPERKSLDDRIELPLLLGEGVDVATRLVGVAQPRKSKAITRRPCSSGKTRSYRCRSSGKPCISTIGGPLPA
jgi:hypothetical protein